MQRNATSNGTLLGDKAHQLEERARQLAFLEDQELKRGSTLNIIPPTPIKKTNHSPAVAAAQKAVISTLRQHAAGPPIAPNPVLVPTMPLAATYLHQQLQPQQQQPPASEQPQDGEADTDEAMEEEGS